MNIITVNLNPCIDWQCTVEKYEHGGLNRIRRTRTDIAGKGINVAIALKNLGLNPICTGFNFLENGKQLTEKLDTIGVEHDFVEAEGAIRVNTKLYEESSGKMTELNQPGAFVPEAAQKKLLEKIENFNQKDTDILVLSGSRPEGVSADFYAKICGMWQGKVFLDTEGENLKLALDAAPPFAIKPNIFELESTFEIKLTTSTGGNLPPVEVVNFCKENLLTRGIKIICVSMGAEGAVLVTEKNSYFSPALKLQAKGVAGAGDAMVAGLVHALALGLPEEKFLQNAMAAAAASVVLDGTQMCTHEGFCFFLEKVIY